jgi:hypothetical protein
MGAPSNETEAETLRRRQVEALEAIAKALAVLTQCIDVEDGVIVMRRSSER